MERKNRITIRLSDEEIEKLKVLSGQAGVSKSEFIRNLLNSIDEKELINKLAQKQEEYAVIKSHLSSIGVNINQMARKLNMNECLNDTDRFLLKQIIEEIKKVYEKLL